MSHSINCGVTAWTGDGFSETSLEAVREVPLTVFVNGREVVTLLCSGKHPKHLAVGFCKSDALIQRLEQLKDVRVEEDDSRILAFVDMEHDPFEGREIKRSVTSGCGKGTNFERNVATISRRRLNSDLRVRPANIKRLARELQRRSDLYKKTRGCHNSSLCSTDEMLVFRDDIGRHNAIDMIVGHCFMNSIPTHDKMIVTTGRVASEILLKAVRIGVPVLASRSRATSLSVELAKKTGITLIGDSGSETMYIYNHGGRIEGLEQAHE